MRAVRIVGVLVGYQVRRAFERVDAWWTLRGVRDAEVAEALHARFRQRRADLDDRLRAQRLRFTLLHGERWFRSWRRRRSVDLPVGITLGAPSMKDSSSTRRSEWYGTHYEPYPEPDHDADWLGTSANPYKSVADVGRRKR